MVYGTGKEVCDSFLVIVSNGSLRLDCPHGGWRDEKRTCPRCGWSGNPEPGELVKWSSMRKGLKLRSCGVPIERRTLAPTPSDCWTAKKALRIARGTDIASAFVSPYISVGGMTGRPSKEVLVA